MTLPVADIDRWNADAVRGVFHAASARGHTTLEASRQLGALAVFDTWEGATAEARNVGEHVIPVVVAKRRGQPAERAYVVLELATFARLIADEAEVPRA